ncbi:MAG: ABC transporter permease [Steroidobacteraceae bacterium]
MFRSYLAAALRNLAGNKFHSFISIAGLAVGISAAIMVTLVIRQQLSFDQFIPGYERTYLGISVLISPGREPYYTAISNNRTAALLKLKFPEIEAATRLAEQEVSLQHGAVEAREIAYWANSDVFSVLPLPVFSGDLASALQRADTAVITRSISRKYFGRDDSVGETLQINKTHPVTITAVIEDLPDNGTHLSSGIFVSGNVPYSKLTTFDNDPGNAPDSPNFFVSVATYIRLTPSASIDRLQAAMPKLLDELWAQRKPGIQASLQLVRLDKVHLFSGLNPEIAPRLTLAAIMGALILLAACINFVNLATAGAKRRALEVGIRKTCGASRRTLVVQFIGEATVYVLFATAFAIALVELLLPHMNAFLNSSATFNYWNAPSILACLGASVIVLGVIAGAYPALVLASFQPTKVLVGKTSYSGKSTLARQGLVTLQFAILIGLIIAVAVVERQRQFSNHNDLSVDTDQLLMVRPTVLALEAMFNPCDESFRAKLQILPEIRGIACTSDSFLTGQSFSSYQRKDGGIVSVSFAAVDINGLELYGQQPLAGRFFDSSMDSGINTGKVAAGSLTRFVINETAVQKLGYSSPREAVGKTIDLQIGKYAGGEIIGVVKDFSLRSMEHQVAATLYTPTGIQQPGFLSIKLSGQKTKQTLTYIDSAWLAAGAFKPIERYFLSDYLQSLYLNILHQVQMLGIFSGIALLLSCLGLIGLSIATAARRTKEIGIRKAMGAGTGEILLLLLWQFTKPVLWANLIAWPATALIMHRWLQGFAYHIDLEPWLFPAATGVALLIASLTVSTHCYLVARAKPVMALRYE